MLEAKKINSSTTINSSFIEFYKNGKTLGPFLNIKIKDTKFSASFSI
jgi:hypothetical protein